MFLMGIFWYHLYDMSNYKLCNLDTYNHNFGSSVQLAENTKEYIIRTIKKKCKLKVYCRNAI